MQHRSACRVTSSREAQPSSLGKWRRHCVRLSTASCAARWTLWSLNSMGQLLVNGRSPRVSPASPSKACAGSRKWLHHQDFHALQGKINRKRQPKPTRRKSAALPEQARKGNDSKPTRRCCGSSRRCCGSSSRIKHAVQCARKGRMSPALGAKHKSLLRLPRQQSLHRSSSCI